MGGKNMTKEFIKKSWVVGLTVLFIIGGLTSNIGADDNGASNMRKTWYIDDDATYPGDGSITDPFKYIWQGTENATSGDELSIASGDYFENVVIDKEDLDLQWHGSDIIGSDTGIPVISGNYKGCVIEIQDSEVNLKELHITASGITARDAGIYMGQEIEYTTIDKCEISDCYYGIWSHKEEFGSTDHTFNNNIIYDIEDSGIIASFSDDMKILNNIITDCKRCGIFIHDCNKAIIDGNTCEDNRYGIGVDVGVDNDITSNTCKGNSVWGFYIVNGLGNTIKGNNFMDNGQKGQATWVEYNFFGSNQWTNNYWGKPGVFIHIIIGVVRKADVDIPWFRLGLFPASSPN